MPIKSKYPFKLIKYDEEFAFADIIEIDCAGLRKKEEMVGEFIPSDEMELQQTCDVLFDDENNLDVEGTTKVNKAYYIKLIKNKPDAPKGTGSALFNKILRELKGKGVIFCLYASPIHPEKGKYYSFKERKVALPKLLEVYRKLGFKSSPSDEQVMYKK